MLPVRHARFSLSCGRRKKKEEMKEKKKGEDLGIIVDVVC